jgi:hypothetical protein
MNIQEYRYLRSEQAALEKMLKELPTANVIDRISLESRKKEIEKELASQTEPEREPVRAKLTFNGKPVIASHGIFVEFGTAVVNAFAEVVAAIAASQAGALGMRGKIPNRDEYRLLITGTALGSFGFELEEAPADNMMLFPEMSPVKSAIEQAKSIMKASIGTDDDLADAIAEVDPRALDALRTFLKTIADKEAVCALEFEDDVFRFTDVGQIHRSEGRLSQDNIREEDQEITGGFQGVLPKRRTFEFLVEDSEEVIAGKVGPEIEDASEINGILKKHAKITVHTKRVGNGQPRYVLLSYDEL